MWSVCEWCNGRKIWNKLSFQIKSNQDLESEEKTMKENIKKMMFKEFFMLGFFCVNDNKDVDMKCPQTMRCIICYDNPILFCDLKT
jgi:hypothetical protein